MKNLFKSILCIFFISLITHPLITNATTFNETYLAPLDIQPILTDNQTGEILYSSIKNVKSLGLQSRSDGQITQSCEINISLPVKNPSLRDAVSGSVEEADCKAILNITYSLNSTREKIKITNISGSWTPQNRFIVVSDRVASVTDGAFPFLNKTLTKYPDSNTFNYNTGWDYLTYYPRTEYTGARGYTEATLTIPSMGGNYNLFFPLSINR